MSSEMKSKVNSVQEKFIYTVFAKILCVIFLDNVIFGSFP